MLVMGYGRDGGDDAYRPALPLLGLVGDFGHEGGGACVVVRRVGFFEGGLVAWQGVVVDGEEAEVNLYRIN